MRLLVIDGNPAWVRSLFTAMPDDVTIDFFRVYSALDYYRKRTGPIGETFRWREIGPRVRELTLLVPGWTRAYAASSAILQTSIRMFRCDPEPARAIIFTSPYYAGAAHAFPAVKKFYYAHDPFLFFDWNTAQIARLEKQILNDCDATLAVAMALVDDFRQQTTRPVGYSPNAASAEFVELLAKERAAVPTDLAAIPRPIVGCVGQINRSYDWELIAGLADAMPDVHFVFVGPMFQEAPDIIRKISAVLRKPNVHHLGAKPHEQLPGYLQHFDVCFNPLAVNAHNDRRSPLRLFDYLATDRPILSTEVREAHEHLPHIEIGRDPASCVELLRKMLSPTYRPDQVARSEYIRRNTWQVRASQFLEFIQKY